jgi:hypothetical protein
LDKHLLGRHQLLEPLVRFKLRLQFLLKLLCSLLGLD